MIGIGGVAYLSLESPILGAFFFSFGLLTIVTQKFYLFTGKVGYARIFEDFKNLPIILAGNMLGTYLMAFYVTERSDLYAKAVLMCETKLSTPLEITYMSSILCGIMMFLAIDNYNKHKNLIFIIMPVMIFILAGFEHSIADMFFLLVTNKCHGQGLLFLTVVILGNAIGSLLFSSLIKEENNELL